MPNLADPTTIMFGKLALATVLGIIVGTERAIAGKQAGTRTFSLVALGACLFVEISNYVNFAFVGFANSPGFAIQPTYMAASVIAGVGFIGAGLIFRHGEVPHGITTAAGMWVAAAVGTAVGFGMYAVAIFTTIITLLIFTGMWFIEHSFTQWFNTEVKHIHRKDEQTPAGQ